MTPDEYITVLEENGIKLLEYQKILLKNLINSDNCIWLIPTRCCGYSTVRTFAELYKLYLEV